MMSKQASAWLGGSIAATGVLVTLVALGLSGLHAAVSAFAGAVLAVANFYVWYWLVGRMLNRQVKSHPDDGPPLSFLLIVKATLGLGAVAVLLGIGLVEPIPFAAGLGSLVVGLLAGATWLVTADPQEEASDAAR